MALTSGTRLGPYEILAPLGQGGMGEVWRARDTRLGREVAIKVLAQHLADEPALRARLEREARTISSLNHPNTCTLFDVGRAPGVAGSGETDFLVMELVEGETLAARLTRGALPGPELLRIAIPIADALARAHRAGVVHRDLKPGNIMLTRTGPKLLDFGLARAAPVPGGNAALGSQSPTAATPLTVEGALVGTFAYMAPEQLEGSEADARSDVWAFGCVLYEMASAQPAFAGRSPASLISAIMTAEPRPLAEFAPLSSPALARLVSACLAKDPEERIQTAQDLKRQLEWLAEGGSSAGLAAPVATRRGRPAVLGWGLAILGLLAIAALSPLVVARLRPKSAVQLSLLLPPRTHFGAAWSGIAISPDGNALAFVGADSSGHTHLWVQPFANDAPTMLDGTEGAQDIFWSPDSRELGFFTGFNLKRVSAAGGPVVTLCDAPAGRGGTWNAHGDIVFAPASSGPLFRVPANGGTPVPVTTLDASRHETGQRFPQFLPDGRHFLYISMPSGPNGWDVCVSALGGHERRRVATLPSGASYVAPGMLVFVNRDKLTAQGFDAGSLRLVGEARAIADAPALSSIDAEPVATGSNAGRLAFPVSGALDTQLEWLDRAGRVSAPIALPPGPWILGGLSPDDRFAALQSGGDLWRADLVRAIATRVTTNDVEDIAAIWSPDGREIAYTRAGRGRQEIMIRAADGTGEPRVLPTTDDEFKLSSDWARDGTMVLNVISPETNDDLWYTAASGTGRPTPFLRTPFRETLPRVSPDGHWIAYNSNESGRREIYVQSFPTPGHKLRLSRDGAKFVWWLPGSDGVCFEDLTESRVFEVALHHSGEDLVPSEPKSLFALPAGTNECELTHDGQRLLACVPVGGASAGSIRVILDWAALLTR